MLRIGWWTLLLGCLKLCALATASGCGGKPVTTAPPASNPQPAQVTAKQPLDLAAPQVEPATPETNAASTEKTAQTPAEPGPLNEVASVPPPVLPKSTERLVLLAPGRPLIVEFQLSIDGEPHTSALERLMDEVLKLADTDGDGRTLWKELCASKRIKYGQYGNLAIDNENGEKQVIDRYDIARDGVVDRSELPRFLTRNAGASRPFSLRGTLNYRDLNRRGSATWRIMDADGDGSISAAERITIGTRLASRDNDDDEIVVASDLNPRLEMTGMPMLADRRRRGPDAARLLGPHADWNAVQQSLEQEYGGGRFLRTGAFPTSPELFAALDANHDGRLRREEYSGLNDVPPHLVIAVEFGKRSSETLEKPVREAQRTEETDAPADEIATPPNQPRLKLISVAPSLGDSASSVVEQPGRLSLSVGGMLLTCYTNDTVASDDFSARAAQTLAMFDQNKDGYLEKNEVPESLQGQLGRFEAVDADEDGKAFPREIEAFFAQQQAGLRAQIHARVTDVEDAVFGALDADHDDRLTSREIEGAGQRLAALDTDGDGRLAPAELPEVLLIGLARGSVETPDATFAPPRILARGPDEHSPRWFTAMDANQDGVISRREFLGSADQFARMDRDQNGLLELGEATSATQQ
jgi:Ca2+-binding EF-hand superfamily protein